MVDENIIWVSLPMPALLLDEEDRIVDINPAAETFLNTSLRSLEGHHVWDKIMVAAPLDRGLQKGKKHLSIKGFLGPGRGWQEQGFF